MAEQHDLPALFDEALALPRADRAEFMAVRCAGRPELLIELESLLAHADTAGDFLEVPAPAVQALGEAVAPEQVGPYRLVQRLGEGGFGEVWRGEQSQPIARSVAVKLIRPGVGSDAALARFAAERQALALLEHPGIARIHDAGTTPEGRPWYAMELIDGPSLTDYCRHKRSGTADRVRLIVQVCNALHHAHERGIVHRDLKPSNVLIVEPDGRPQPKIIDFGIAKLLEQDAEAAWRTEAGQVVGTPAYMSPEQARGEVDAIDARTDVHALGVLLFELLTGTLPFEPRGELAQDMMALHRRICEDEAPRPSSRIGERSRETDYRPPVLPRAVRGDLDWIVLKALAKERERRYATALELAEDLERFLRDRPVMATPPSRLYRLHKWFLRHRAAAIAGALAVLLGGGGTVASLQLLSRAERSEQDARAEAQKLGAVAGFLRELLASADPEHSPGRELTVREVLDSAASRLGQGLAPEVESGLRYSIGVAYRSLGREAQAEQHLRAALDLADRAGAPERGPVRRELGLLYTDAGRLNEAEALLQDARRLAHEDGNAQEEAMAIDALGVWRGRSSDFAGALAAHREAAALLPATAPARLATAMRLHLAEVQERLGKYQEAGTAFAEARRRAQQAGDPGLPLLLQIDSARLHMLLRQGRAETALQLAADNLALAKRIYGEDHFETGYHRCNYGEVLQENHRLEDSERELRAGIGVLQAARPEGSISESRALLDLGWTQSLLQQNEAAELSMRRGLQLQKQLLGPDHPDVAVGLRNLSRVLRQRQAYAEAEQSCREALQICQQKNGKDHLSVAVTQHALALALLSQGKNAEAEPCLEEAVRIGTATLPDDHPNLAEFRLRLGYTRMLLGRSAAARPLFEQVYDSMRERRGGDERFAVQAAKNMIKYGIDVSDFELVDRWRQRLPEAERNFARDVEAQRRQQLQAGK